ncbi:class I SAM-dependent methyltransferase [Fimbriiglobus ruber]|uniref:Methyltransferase n=1 Tax=Fimbriiglobus ruber TaxID=1908690 RepID=A0A225E8U3_9BACT|nr:class I SAM-dependent methyltransferase [Fimbriiglobus ruber]OWK46496.1 Methyltransferase [Fimbriiglobus ruber]
MLNTGERYLPDLDGADILYEHWHRYFFATQFVAGKSVLDVASGEGYGSALLARTAGSVVGVDLDAAVVATAGDKYRAENLTFCQGSAAALPISGQHLFDVITSFETIEHLTPDDQTHFLDEAKRLLKPGGLLLISTPNRVLYTERPRFHNPFHLHEFDQEEYAAFLGTRFRTVRTLSQHVYPCSYIWDDEPAPGFSEYQLAIAGGQLQPAGSDRKEKLYFVALCSDEPVAPQTNSALLDLDGLLFGRARGYQSTLFVDTGSGFRVEECDTTLLNAGGGEFRLTFDLGAPRPVRSLRWDPLELRTCRVRLDRVEWEDDRGEVHAADPATVGANGDVTADGVRAFDTIDPWFVLPVSGNVARVTVAGWYEADEVGATLTRVDATARRVRECVLAVNDRDRQLLALNEQARIWEEELLASGARTRERDEQLRALDKGVRDRDEQLRLLEAHARERDEQLRAVDALLRERDEQLGVLGERARIMDDQLRAADESLRVMNEQARDRARIMDDQLRAADESLRVMNEQARDREERLRAIDEQARSLATAVIARDDQLRELAATFEAARTQHLTSTLSADTGFGFRSSESRSALLPAAGGDFELTFDLGDPRPIRQLRWQPLDSRTCRVRLDRIEWEDESGHVHTVDPAAAATNGDVTAGGVLAFDTTAPVVVLPVSGNVARVTVAGWYEADDLTATLARIEAVAQRTRERAAAGDEQIQFLRTAIAGRDEQLRNMTVKLRSTQAAEWPGASNSSNGVGSRLAEPKPELGPAREKVV